MRGMRGMRDTCNPGPRGLARGDASTGAGQRGAAGYARRELAPARMLRDEATSGAAEVCALTSRAVDERIGCARREPSKRKTQEGRGGCSADEH